MARYSSRAPHHVSPDRICSFCRSHIGYKVGRGECAELAVAALQSAGAYSQPLNRNNGDYVWGDLVGTVAASRRAQVATDRTGHTVRSLAVHAGDIIQFHDARFYHSERFGYSYKDCVRHTAVVKAVGANGVCRVFEQNVGGRRAVLESEYSLPELVAGWVRFYRPIPKS